MNLIAAVLGPAVVAGLVYFVGGRMWRKGDDVPDVTWTAPIALALGYLTTHLVLIGTPHLPPLRAMDALFCVVPLVAVLSLIRPLKPMLDGLLMLLMLGGGLWIQFKRLAENTWEPRETVFMLTGMVVFGMMVWKSAYTMAERRPTPETSFRWWILASCTAGVLVCTSSIVLGQLAGGVAGVLGAAWVLAMIRGKIILHVGGDTLFAFIFISLVAQGYLFADTPLYIAVLLLIALPLGVLGDRITAGQMSPIKARAIRAVTVATPALIALAIALTRYLMESPDEYYY